MIESFAMCCFCGCYCYWCHRLAPCYMYFHSLIVLRLMCTSHSHLLFIHHYYSLFPTVTMHDVMMITLLSLALYFFSFFCSIVISLTFFALSHCRHCFSIRFVAFTMLFSVTNLIIRFKFFSSLSTSQSLKTNGMNIKHNRTLVRWIEKSYDSQWIFIWYESTNNKTYIHNHATKVEKKKCGCVCKPE